MADRAIGVHQRGEPLGQPVLKLRDDGRRAFDKRGGLLDQGRNDQQERHDKDQRRDNGDRRHRKNTAEANFFKPVGDRIEKIGDCPAKNEGQKNVAKRIEHNEEDRRGDPPIFRLFFDG